MFGLKKQKFKRPSGWTDAMVCDLAECTPSVTGSVRLFIHLRRIEKSSEFSNGASTSESSFLGNLFAIKSQLNFVIAYITVQEKMPSGRVFKLPKNALGYFFLDDHNLIDDSTVPILRIIIFGSDKLINKFERYMITAKICGNTYVLFSIEVSELDKLGTTAASANEYCTENSLPILEFSLQQVFHLDGPVKQTRWFF